MVRDALRPPVAPAPQLSPTSSARALANGGVVACISRSCESSDTSGSVTQEAYTEAVQMVADALVAQDVAPDDLVDYLTSSDAAEQPIRCLALIDVLHRRSGSDDSTGLGTAKRAALQQLAEACGCSDEPSGGSESVGCPSLRRRVIVKYFTWSQARDCRGFRARDEVHRINVGLHTLLAQPDHRAWNVLSRGVVNEVRQIRILADE